MVNGRLFSSSESNMSFSNIVNKELLEFYQNKFDDLQKKDNYKEKVDKYLKDLIADRHELEAEVFRKGAKISELQKALSDLRLHSYEERERFLTVAAENERLKHNEEALHKYIQELLKQTKDKNLRDRIIYTLEDPKVDIAYRYADGKSEGVSSSSLLDKKASEHGLRKEVQQLQSKIDEYTKVSKGNSDVILEDCKETLAKSREKIAEDEEEIINLQRRLQESEAQLQDLKSYCSRLQQNSANSLTSLKSRNTIDQSSEKIADQNIISSLKHIKHSLVELSTVYSKKISLLNRIFSSRIFVKAASTLRTKFTSEFADKADIIQLKNLIRQCTQMSYDISNTCKSIKNYRVISKSGSPVSQKEFDELEIIINNLVVSTTESDLLVMELAREAFFEYLMGPTPSFTSISTNTLNNSKYANELIKMEGKLKYVVERIDSGARLIEQMIQKFEHYQSTERLSKTSFQITDENQTQAKQYCSQENINLMNVGERSFGNSNHQWTVRRTRSEPIGGDDVKRKIDKTLIKIQQIEKGEHLKDNEFCKHLVEEINILTEKLKALNDEFNMKSLQTSFSEYSLVTLKKLETLTRQSRDAVLSAEAQISAYRSKNKVLSQKLRDTEELLRENITECLGLKKKLQQQEVQIQNDKVKLGGNLDVGLMADLDEITAVKEVVPSIKPSSRRKPEGPFECMFCRQGSDHKLCEEKINELRADNRKLTTELKFLKQEMNEEKKASKMVQEKAGKIEFDSHEERVKAKATIQSLETKNASLLEQLRVCKNRLKTIERYRRLEIEGLQTDIKNLKAKINELQKQLTKAVLVYENDQKDMELLKTVHGTALRSKSAVGALQRLKAKLYEIETDFKRL